MTVESANVFHLKISAVGEELPQAPPLLSGLKITCCRYQLQGWSWGIKWLTEKDRWNRQTVAAGDPSLGGNSCLSCALTVV